MAEGKKRPHCKKPMTRLTTVDKNDKVTVRWVCLSALCKIERELERRRAA